MTPTATAADASIEASIDWRAMPAELRAAVQAALQSRDQRIAALEAELAVLKAQLDWFRRQVFGSKSERHVADLAQQLPLGGLQAPVPEVPNADEPSSVVVKRCKARSDFAADGMEHSFFDAQRVEVVPIEVPNDAAAGLSPEQYEVVGVKTSHRLAQRPGSYVVLEYRRSVIKRHDSGTLHCPPAPQGVFEGSRADVSFVVGLLVDKLCWHLPLYRQHQRLLAAGFKLSRQWLTLLVHQAGRLLEPIYDAQLESIRASRVKTMDETPIKAGHAGPGKMRGAYYWPVYGEQDEVCFVYRQSRRHEHADEVLGPALLGMVLLSDGYGAYKSWAKKTGAVHAECWVHYPESCFILGTGPAVAAHVRQNTGVALRIILTRATHHSIRVGVVVVYRPHGHSLRQLAARQTSADGSRHVAGLARRSEHQRHRRAALSAVDRAVPPLLC